MGSLLQWIQDREQAARSETLVQDLNPAQSLEEKYQKLESEVTGHQPFIDVTLATGKKLLDENHPRKEEIAQKSLQLKTAWNQLKKYSAQIGEAMKELQRDELNAVGQHHEIEEQKSAEELVQESADELVQELVQEQIQEPIQEPKNGKRRNRKRERNLEEEDMPSVGNYRMSTRIRKQTDSYGNNVYQWS